ncbi:aminotransferase class V-fold PLP-dependent enzyme [Nocardia sp. NPDC049737]|uniref:aminotransferase class V-fold PLP-dependent enzyme n=1 Tax=Nocardia sp. NPDC049737 TaxID=3154358 RepID=UPI003425A300
MTADEFREYGRAVVDWLADYWDRVESLPVLAQVKPGQVREQLPARAPEHGEDFYAVLEDMDTIVVPGLTHWQHPSFFAYYPSNTSGPAVLAELLTAGLNVQGMMWQTGPACTELEQHVLDWLAGLLGLSDRFLSTGSGGGVIQDTASSAILVALLAALHRASNGRATRDGVASGRFTVYTSAEGHSACEKAARVAGLGAAALRTIDTRADFSMDPDALRNAMKRDIAAGYTPAMVLATIGTTSTGAIDPVPQIGSVCTEFGAWLHVDAAHAGVAAICPELRWIHHGVNDYADSYATNPHKWLLTTFDCDACYVADRSGMPTRVASTGTDSARANLEFIMAVRLAMSRRSHGRRYPTRGVTSRVADP